ncbi:MAG: hypothetical protein GX444_09120 [Myxococcales bacterium]|nr:hypothetical protein [Myxococcales bacterium]
MDWSALLGTVETIVRRAGQLALDLQPHLEISRKPDGSVVTQADRAVEQLLADELTPLVPGSLFLGEERPMPEMIGDAPVWIVDPIDGTDSYRQGLAYFGVSVGLAVGKQLKLGVFYNPRLDELFGAARGHGAFLNGAPIHVMRDRRLETECFICGPSDFHRSFRFFLPVKVRSLGSTAAHFALVADGRACFCFCRPWIWDVAAGCLLVEEAGGEIRHLDGTPFRIGAFFDGRRISPPLMGGPPEILDQINGLIRWTNKE